MARRVVADADGEQLGRRERKRLALRGRLCAAALELFSAHGYEVVSMTDIADRVDVARATVFNYFPRKELFLEEWGVRRRALVSQVLEEVHDHGGPAIEKLRRYLAELSKLNMDSRAESVVLMRASARFGALLVERPYQQIRVFSHRPGVVPLCRPSEEPLWNCGIWSTSSPSPRSSTSPGPQRD
jgi:AcrR family transcriptional regulator